MDFLNALKKEYSAGEIPVIPDIKVYSPKNGDLMHGRDPADIAQNLVRGGAEVLSVVTEEKEFHGSLNLLERIASSVHVPILRKDFIEDVSDLDASVKAGAKAILLMVSCLGEKKLEYLYREALKRRLTPFVETHSRKELEFAGRLGAKLVGINNRNILKLEKDNGDVNVSAGLLKYAPKDAMIISESSIRDAVDVRKVIRQGAAGVLAGTCILNAADPVKKYYALKRKTAFKICGIMSEDGLNACMNSAVDLAGMVVDYPVDVPWNISVFKAAEIAASAKGKIRTCAVTGGSVKKIMEIAETVRPDLIQLHGTETLDETEEIADRLGSLGIGCIRSIPDNDEMLIKMFGTADIEKIVSELEDSDVDILLFDSRDASNAASSGSSLLSSHRAEVIRKALSLSSKTTMFGGGITESNAAEICRSFQPDIIDVMTGSELSPGQKSEEKINRIICSAESGR